jgi:hypothetical protein
LKSWKSLCSLYLYIEKGFDFKVHAGDFGQVMNAVLKKTITEKKEMNAAHCCLPSHSLRNESPHLPLSKKTKTRIRSNIYIYMKSRFKQENKPELYTLQFQQKNLKLSLVQP